MSQQIDNSEIWRQIPPEEKFALLSRAHSMGVTGAVMVVLAASTFAICFKNAWLMWGSILVSPIVFQLVAGKSWRDLRPRMVLEYLAARSAARRYAFTAESKELTVEFLFRGYLEEFGNKEPDDPMAALEAAVEQNMESSVWVALFGDALVMMSEKAGGAECEFAHLLNAKLQVEGKALDDGGDYSSNRELLFTAYPERGNAEPKNYRLTSTSPAALVVFEKKLVQHLEQHRLEHEKEEKRLAQGGTLALDH